MKTFFQKIFLLGVMTLLALGASATPDRNYLCFTANTDESSVRLEECTPDETPYFVNLEYSHDGSNWSEYNIGSIVDLLHAGDKVYFRNADDGVAAGFSLSSHGYYAFDMSGSIAASGNIMSLIDKSCASTTIPCANCFYGLFKECTSLTSAPELPATTLAAGCYRNMFCGCTKLVTAPTLPATTLSESCYHSMFEGCTKLAAAPELPATTLSESCYDCMFYDCTSLATAPTLPATTLAAGCYRNMFSGCTKLVTAPTLPATTLAESCYYCMFDGCTNLTTAPALPATTLAVNCYRQMFVGCIRLAAPPALPATTLVESCYEGMFYVCTSLEKAPALPAMILAVKCYKDMFAGCIKLAEAPTLPATTLVNGCYNSMFYLCSKLNKVDVGFTDWGENNTSNWLNGVAATGDFICPDELSKKYGASYIPESWAINGTFPYLNFKANAPSSRVQLNMVGGESTGLALEYSTDECQTWAPYTITYDADTNGSIGQTITLANAGDKVYFRKSGDGVATGFSTSDNSYYRFSVYGSVAADGNIMSLIDKHGETTAIPSAYCFAHLFESCTGLTTAPQLPATTLKPYCYASMFSGCTGLTAAPELPATTLEKDCYNKMFYYCTKLNEIKVGFTDWTVTVNGIEYTPTKDWLYNVSSDGVFYSHAGLDRTQRDASHIPAGWMTMNYRYVVTANSSDESKGTVSGGGTYEEGTEVTLTAAPAEGCIFKQWSDGTTANPYVFTVTKDVTLTAQFTKSYTVQVSSADESKGTVSGGGTYVEGTEVTLTATPAEYYKFEKWSDGTTANPYVFTAEKDVELTAMFNKITYTITAVSNDESYGTVTGGGTYEAGEEVYLIAMPEDCYIFTGWSDGTKDNPYDFTAMKDVSLTAIFEKAPWDFKENRIYYKVHGDEVGVVDADNIDIVIPETVTHNDKTYRVTSIEAEAFRGNEDLHSVLIPNGVKEIGDAAFSGCNLLYKVILGADVEVIGDGAFTNCITLGEMYFWRVTPPEGILQVDNSLHIFIPIISDSQEYEKFVVDAGSWGSHTIYNDIIVYKLQIWPKDAVVEIKGKRYGNGDIIGPFDGSLLNPRGTALQVSDVKDPGMFGYDLISVQIKDGEIFVNYASNGSIVFTDATPYGYANEKTFPELTYSRTFDNTEWQALYVPFSMSYDEWKTDYDIAKILNFIEYDDDDDGTVDRTYLVAIKKTSGSTEPNTPYLIRAKSTGISVLYLGERTLQPAETNSLECSSTENTYTFTGTYTGVTDMYDRGYYAMSGGSLKRANSASVVLKPQRWYMALTPKKGAPAATKAQSIQILVDGEEGIMAPSTSPRGESPATFDLMGRRMMAPAKGINIVNGKKIIK